ncbi:MAG: hypothetical protein IBX62_08310 [Coriobacteriia bacterium]|nr:hypothetical protein [Coriobacteriia bacterium]
MQACKRKRTFIVLEGDRRHRDRRSGADRLHYPERRTGFDRRVPQRGHPAARFAERALRLLRAEPWRLGLLLSLVTALSALDMLFTVKALARGAEEANPVMASLLAADVRLAAAVKMGITCAVAGGLWRLRRYRRVLEATLAILAGMLLLVTYHIVLQALMA